MNPPSDPHKTLFTYTECSAQTESARRVHLFAHVPGREELVVFYARALPAQSSKVWRMRILPQDLSNQIQATFHSLRLPLAPKVRNWNSLHFMRTLEVEFLGASIVLGWDTHESGLCDALEPLTSLLFMIVQELKADMAKHDLSVCSDENL
jgi:hypothetical protein